MSQHITDDLLRRFVAGDVDDEVAVAVATHVDDCARCATQAATLDPLGAAFASVDDPVVPDDLVEAAVTRWRLERASSDPAATPATELIAAAALLSAAAVLMLISGDPAGLLAELALGLGAAASVSGIVVARLLASPEFLLAAAVATFAGCLLLARGLNAKDPSMGRRQLA